MTTDNKNRKFQTSNFFHELRGCHHSHQSMSRIDKREKNQSVIDLDKRNEEFMLAVKAHMRKYGCPSRGQAEWDVLESQLERLESDMSESLTKLHNGDENFGDLEVAKERLCLLTFLTELKKSYTRPDVDQLESEYEELDRIYTDAQERLKQKDRSEKRKKDSKGGAAPPKKHKDAEADQEADADQESDVQEDRSVKRKKNSKDGAAPLKKHKDAEADQGADEEQEADADQEAEDHSVKRKKPVKSEKISKVRAARPKKRKEAEVDQEEESDDEEDEEEGPTFTINVPPGDEVCGLDMAGTSFQAKVVLYHPPAKAWVVRRVETGDHFFVNKDLFENGIEVPLDKGDLANQRPMKYKIQEGVRASTGKRNQTKLVEGEWTKGHLLLVFTES